jgi:molybdopterin-guanine dinucleotide biosynthesis protein A
MMMARDITGVILAGGISSRFGSDKALALLHDKFLIQHVKDTLTTLFSDCLVITNTPEQYAFLNMPMIMDRYQGMGPLAGIHAALLHAAKPWIFVLGCDMPKVPPELITFLCSFALEEKVEAVIPWLEAGPEPLCGLYCRKALSTIELQLNNRKPQVNELLGKLRVRKVKDEEIKRVTGDRNIFCNINRKQDLEKIT